MNKDALEIEELKQLLSKLISPRIVHKSEVCDFGFKEQFLDNRPTTQELVLTEKIQTMQRSIEIIGRLIVNAFDNMEKQ